MNAEDRQITNVRKKLLSDRIITSTESGDDGTIDPKIIASISASVVIFIVFLVFVCLCRRRRRIRRRRIGKGRVISTSTATTSCPTSLYVIPSKVELKTTEDVTRRYQRSVSNLSAKSQIYLVPFDVLPSDFDFSSREVQVKADYVILKDLALLEQYPSNGIVNESYESQEPYSPHVGNGSLPLGGGERYQKQSPYNPTFY